jgi:hypothetical protein
MKWKFILLLLIIMTKLSSQSTQEITIENSIFSRYYLGYERIDGPSLGRVLKSNPKAYRVYRATIVPKVSAHIFGISGGFLVVRGFYLNAQDRVNKEKSSIYLGCGLSMIGIILRSYSGIFRKAAIREYNSGLHKGFGKNKDQIHFQFSGNGICFSF